MQVPAEVKDIHKTVQGGTDAMFENPLAGIGDSIASAIPSAIDTVASTANDMFTAVSNAVSSGNLSQDQADQLNGACPAPIKSMSSLGGAAPAASALESHGATQTANLRDNMSMVSSANTMADGFGENTNICDKLDNTLGSISGAADQFLSDLQSGFASLQNAIGGAFDNISSAIKGAYETASNAVTTWLDGLTGPAGDNEFLSKLSDFVNSAEAFVSDLQAKAGAAWNAINDKIAEVGNKINEVVGNINTMIETELANLNNMFNELADKAFAFQLPSLTEDPCMKKVIAKVGKPALKLAIRKIA